MKVETATENLTFLFEEDLLSTNVQSLGIAMLPHINAEDKKPCVLDLTQVRMIDSQGINLLIAAYRACAKVGRVLRLANVSAEQRKLLTYLNLATRFGI
jgi:anti-anti-sigma factor